ncbi:MAG: hypothetical protein ABI432_08310 [Flavobacteriales bacterium]
MRAQLLTASLLLAGSASAQVGAREGESAFPPGLPPDKRVDVTGDGIADLVITGGTRHVNDREMGPGGWHLRWVAPLPGTRFLFRCTQNRSDYYRVEEGQTLSAVEVEAGLRYAQLCWGKPEDGARIDVLTMSFGWNDPSGWLGADDYKEGTLVVRSTTGPQAAIAAFTVDMDVIADTIGITPKGSIPVDAHFGEFDLYAPISAKDSMSRAVFGHEFEPQLIIPPGVPPDERLDLTSDDIPDVALTGAITYADSSKQGGWYRRGVAAMPGTSFLQERQADGSYDWFKLKWGGSLTPTELEMRLQSGTLRWADPAQERVMVLTLEQSFGLPIDDPEHTGWYYPGPYFDDLLVYRATQFGRPVLGAFEIFATAPGGVLAIREQALVEAGKALRAQ